MSSIEPDHGAGQEESAREDAFGFIIAGGDGAILLERGEDILDEVSAFIEMGVIVARRFAVGAWRDHHVLSCRPQGRDEPGVGIVAFVGQHGADGIILQDIGQKSIRALEIAGLPGADVDIDRIAQRIGNQADFAR